MKQEKMGGVSEHKKMAMGQGINKSVSNERDIWPDELESDKQEEFKNETILEGPAVQAVEETYESGTIKITEELAKKINFAITSRVNSTAEYTEQRRERIKKNYEFYEQKNINTKAINRVYYPAIFNAVEDWLDDLYIMFSELPKSVEVINYRDNSGESFISKSMELDETNYSKGKNYLFSLLKAIVGNKLKDKGIFYFKKADIVKAVVKNIIEESGFLHNLREFLKQGVVSGLFCYKEGYSPKRKNKLSIHEDTEGSKQGKEYIGLGRVKRILESYDCFNLTPVDTRRLIFPKTGFKNGVIEEITSSFQNIIGESLDADGKPKPYAIYDMSVLNRLKKYIKDNNRTNIWGTDDNKFFSEIYSEDENESEMQDLFNLVGECRLFEGHNIEMVIDGVLTKCLVTTLYLDNRHIPIRCQPSWYIDATPYKFRTFKDRDGDCAGIGLPEILEPMQEMLNNLENYCLDQLMFALYGVIVGDKDKIVDQTALKSIMPRTFVQLKNMEGQSIKDAMDWWHPPMDIVKTAMEMVTIIDHTLKVTSRKGPSGEKIQPNPSATEAASIIGEAQKSVNSVAISLNEMMEEIIENGYIYTMLNRSTYFDLKVSGKRISNEKEQVIDDAIKSLRLTPEEVFINGINFQVKCLDFDPNKQAVEKQQLMQAIDLLYSKIGITEESQSIDAMGNTVLTKKDKTFIDETGTEIVIDEFALLTRAFKSLGFDISDLFKKKDDTVKSQSMMPGNNAGQAGNPNASMKNALVPPINSNPSTANIQMNTQKIR